MGSEHLDGEAVSFFDQHAEYYDLHQYQTGRRTFINGRHDTIVAMLDRLALRSNLSVLDAGCGPGNLVLEFARRGHRVTAIDAAPGMIGVARQHARRAGFGAVRFQVSSIEALPFADGSFDLVCSAGVIEYLHSCDGAIREMARVLRPGGLLLLPTTNVLAPAHWSRPLFEPISRIPAVARLFGLQPGRFRLRYSFLPRFAERIRAAGLVPERERHFYLTLPRPLDRMFPRTTRQLESWFDRYMETPAKYLAEGYLVVARRS